MFAPPLKQQKEPLAGLLNPRANLSQPSENVNQSVKPPDRLADLLGSTKRETLARVGRGMNDSQCPPGQPAYRHGWTDPAERSTVDEDPEGQTPLPYGLFQSCKRRLERGGEG